MTKPPASPPSKTQDADRHRHEGAAGGDGGTSADETEHARREGKARPPSTRS